LIYYEYDKATVYFNEKAPGSKIFSDFDVAKKISFPIMVISLKSI